MSTRTPSIRVEGLSVSYDKKLVLTNIYFETEPGKIYGVIGPNGAGKSTLFKAMLGLVEPNAGEVRFFGEPVEKQRKHIAYVPQRDDVDWTFPATVMDVVLMGRYPHKKIFERLTAMDRLIAQEALRELGIEALRDRQIGALSGGQQQRVFLARALCQQPDIYLLDEPFVGVDMTTETRIVQLLKDLALDGKTILVIHHDLSSVERYFDRVILLNQRLIAIGETATTFTPENIAQTYSSQLPVLHKTPAG
ncbi:MAG: metal ABC transporter ATP-binding protein [Bacteroidetes bacterium]|nr:MAG: metal ABC transporter ATP-binding protein [Bacteroidota bacterium]